MRKPTIQDVARQAGVGVGTVSRVLNNHSAVKEATRDAVLRAMTELDYTPNPHARRIAGGKSYTISVLLPVMTTEFYVRLLNGLETAFQEARYDVAIFPLMDRSRLERYLGSHTLAYQADGLVMATYNLSKMFDEKRLKLHQPAVLVDAYSETTDCVYMDNVRGGEIAGEYAATFSGPIHALWVETELDQLFTTRVFEDRRKGFLNALNVAGMELGLELTTSFDAYAARTVAADLLNQTTFPCTVFASADMIANAVLDEVKTRQLTPGVDVRVIGFDDQPWAEQAGLTTLHQPVENMAFEAAQLLLSRLSGFKGAPRARKFTPTLVVRKTT